MKSPALQCPACEAENQPGSRFCNQCGKPLPAAESEATPSTSDLVAATRARSDELQERCLEYFGRDKSDVKPFDYVLTQEIVRAYSVFLSNCSQEKTPLEGRADRILLLESLWPEALPQRLESGIVVAEPTHPVLVEVVIASLSYVQRATYRYLDSAYERLERESGALRTSARTQAIAEGLTMGEVQTEASVYYEAFLAGNFDVAMRGFRRLMSLYPGIAYYRNLIGGIHFETQEYEEALGETLYGRALDPESLDLTANLARYFVATGFPIAAVELDRDFRARFAGKEDEEAYQETERSLRLAKVISTGLGNLMVGLLEEEASGDQEISLFSQIEPLERPWLVGFAPDSIPTGEGESHKRPSVFLSHSHVNRDSATRLQAVLERNGADTFLDQDEILPGEDLPVEIAQGLEGCDMLLLLWSGDASRSYWVGREWRQALELGKPIIPYLLDDTSLRSELKQLFYVEARDSQLKHANLLRAVFGSDFMPRNRSELFPGRWKLTIESGNAGVAEYELTLRASGQIEGTGSLAGSLGDLAGGLAESVGMGQIISGMKLTLSGNWSFEEPEEILTLDVTFRIWGQLTKREKLRIQTDGGESGPIRGQEFNTGATWILERLPAEPA